MNQDDRRSRYRALNKLRKTELCKMLRDAGLIGSMYPPEQWRKDEVIYALIDQQDAVAAAEAARAEVQSDKADATAPLSAGGSLPLPYAYCIDRPAPHRPEGEFMMSYGTWDTNPGALTTVHHAATYAGLQARTAHQYWGPMTVWVWAHRGEEEHYRNPPPATAYVLQLGDAPTLEHNPVYSLCVPCQTREAEKREP